MIIYKKGVDPRELSRIDPKLRRILEIYVAMAWFLFGDDVVITSIWRNDRSSTHYWYRAVDIAILHRGGISGSERLRQSINVLVPYGDGVHETVSELRHGTAPHSHLQTRA